MDKLKIMSMSISTGYAKTMNTATDFKLNNGITKIKKTLTCEEVNAFNVYRILTCLDKVTTNLKKP